jgi:hypothetical protein
MLITATLWSACGKRNTAKVGLSSTLRGRIALAIKDGPPKSSDGREITKLEIDITKIALEADGVETGGTADDNNEGNSEETGVVVFDAGTGKPRTVDLLKVTTFSELLTTVTVPAGTYGGAEISLSGARAVFKDDTTQTPVTLVLEGDGKNTAEFDFVPVVSKDAAAHYWLGHDGVNDQSGEVGQHGESGDAGDGEHGNKGEVEVKGKIATAGTDTLTLDSQTSAPVNFAAATITLSNGSPGAKTDLKVGTAVEVEGAFDTATGAITAHDIRIE